MIGGMSGVESNIIPYGLYMGVRSNLRGLNLIGLKRKKLSKSNIALIHKNFKKIFSKDNTILNNITKLNNKDKSIKEINEIVTFIKKNHKRGICTI